MRSSLPPLGPPVSRDRVITSFPKWYTPAACLQLREHFHGQVSAACQRGNTGTVGLKLSKVVVVGDLYVGKTSLIHRFCKNVFNRDYKATIGVDFEIERFEVAGIPFSLQIWDTAGQEKFKCIASAYYRGAQVIITAFDLTDVQTLAHTRQWLEDALRENEPGACFLFLVGTKKDLLVRPHRKSGSLGQQGHFSQSGAVMEQVEAEAVRLANEMQAEYWSVSAKTGENVKAFFSRVAALTFERAVLQDLEQRSNAWLQVGDGDLIRTCRNGESSTRYPGQHEALQPGLLLAEPSSEAPTHHTCEHPPCGALGSTSRQCMGSQGRPPPAAQMVRTLRGSPGGLSLLQSHPTAPLPSLGGLRTTDMDTWPMALTLGTHLRSFQALSPAVLGQPQNLRHLHGPGEEDLWKPVHETQLPSLFGPLSYQQDWQLWASEPQASPSTVTLPQTCRVPGQHCSSLAKGPSLAPA